MKKEDFIALGGIGVTVITSENSNLFDGVEEKSDESASRLLQRFVFDFGDIESEG
ncbi:MAG: hypothetical protein ACUVXA_10600 [Candidatus Jordarchaeum sp.]|uniref:hypothetical protein n=1 Tax=Candidatus Jordarchaeum sp. TaxID=2823881 RepID=UPI00404A7CC3